VRVTGINILPGSPIRTPSDHSSVGSSPRLIAASHVLHRLLVPRHPPCALTNLATKMLASTVQFSTNGRPPAHPHSTPTPPPRKPGQNMQAVLREAGPVQRETSPLPQDPTACHQGARIHPPPVPPHQTLHRGDGSTSRGRRPGPSQRSTPSSSPPTPTAGRPPHTPTPEQLRDRRCAGCSLERR
jgi:hypothetical protein